MLLRDAKLYLLEGKDWTPLKKIIAASNVKFIEREISIYQLFESKSTGNHYAIVTLTKEADEIVAEYGAYEATADNQLRLTLHTYFGETLFGEKANIINLKKIP